jgi:hypothetical protein
MSQQYPQRAATEEKAPPTAEKSLNNISWHLKTLVEEMKKFNDAMLNMQNSQKERERPMF